MKILKINFRNKGLLGLILFFGIIACPQESFTQSSQAKIDNDIVDGITRIAGINQHLAAAPSGKAVVTALLEDFETGIPASWTVIDNAGNGMIWNTNGSWGEGNYTNGSGMSAMACSDCFGSADFDTELITPEITLPAVATNAMLEFEMNYQNFGNFDFFDIDITTDGGTTWTNLMSFNEDHGGFRSAPGENVMLALDPALAGNDTFSIRFRYYDPTNFDFDWYISIDDVHVTYCTPDIPSMSQWGLMILGLLIASLGLVYIGRTRRSIR